MEEGKIRGGKGAAGENGGAGEKGGLEEKMGFVVYSCSCSTFILYVSVNSGISFCLIFGSFLTFWVIMGYFWG